MPRISASKEQIQKNHNNFHKNTFRANNFHENCEYYLYHEATEAPRSLKAEPKLLLISFFPFVSRETEKRNESGKMAVKS